MEVLNLGPVDMDGLAHAIEQVHVFGEGWGKIIIEYKDDRVFGIGMEIIKMTHERKPKPVIDSE